MTYAGLMSSTYSNMESAFKEYTTLTRVPMWNDWEEQMAVGLREELMGNKLNFDISNVSALSQDDEMQAEVLAQWQANLITQNEARVTIGYAELPEGNRFFAEVAPVAPLFGSASADEPA